MNKKETKITTFLKQNKNKKIVAIQGLGFVGSAMLTAVAGAKNKKGKSLYAVIGVDLPGENSDWKIKMINEGRLPVESTDEHLYRVFKSSFKSGNIMATTDKRAYSVADTVIVSINLDVKKGKHIVPKNRKVLLDGFIRAMRELAKKIKPGSLVIIESTLPPGTCEKLVNPVFKKEFKKRHLNERDLKLAYSYERVMPGKNYLKSITSYYRVFSGITDKAKKETRAFLRSIINTDKYPLTELPSVTAAEIGKVLENSYRAINIALIQEWTEFAELAGVNLFEVIDGIKKRDTHKNIMLPGFGVGGYCLTKDPVLAEWGNSRIFSVNGRLDMTLKAVGINDIMPLHSFMLLKKHMKKIKGKRVLLMGVSYLRDVADTRFSPSELFYKKCVKEGAHVIPHDPLVDHWPELGIEVMNGLQKIEKQKVDAIVFAVKHEEYTRLKPVKYTKLLKRKGLILDSNNVIAEKEALSLRKLGFRLAGVGKGHWNSLTGKAK